MSQEEAYRPEDMGAFFDLRADGYDDYIRDAIFSGDTFNGLYGGVSAPIGRTEEPISVLDLGCGTGLELEALFARAPNARVTGVDLSENMLDRLRARYSRYMDQITLVVDSYLTMPLQARGYDYCLSVLSMHHLLPDPKRALYRRIRAALKPGGMYIEGDSVVPPDMEGQFLDEYYADLEATPEAGSHAGPGQYHIDIPFSLPTQRALLLEAGFRDFELIWQRERTMVWNAAVYAVRA